MGMNALPGRQQALLKGGLQRREKCLSMLVSLRFGDVCELSGKLIARINKVP